MLAPCLVGLPRDLVIVGEEPVVLVELNVVEQRYRAVLEVLEGVNRPGFSGGSVLPA
jgi:hypothetical protein